MRIEATYSPTIMDGAVVRFETGYDRGKRRGIFDQVERTEWSAEINASRNGVSINGDWPIYKARESVDTLKEILDVAWDAHIAIRDGRDGGHDAAKEIVAKFNAKQQERPTP